MGLGHFFRWVLDHLVGGGCCLLFLKFCWFCVIGGLQLDTQFVASRGSRFLMLDVIGRVCAHRGWSQNCPSTLKSNVHKVSAFAGYRTGYREDIEWGIEKDIEKDFE